MLHQNNSVPSDTGNSGVVNVFSGVLIFSRGKSIVPTSNKTNIAFFSVSSNLRFFVYEVS